MGEVRSNVQIVSNLDFSPGSAIYWVGSNWLNLWSTALAIPIQATRDEGPPACEDNCRQFLSLAARRVDQILKTPRHDLIGEISNEISMLEAQLIGEFEKLSKIRQISLISQARMLDRSDVRCYLNEFCRRIPNMDSWSRRTSEDTVPAADYFFTLKEGQRFEFRSHVLGCLNNPCGMPMHPKDQIIKKVPQGIELEFERSNCFLANPPTELIRFRIVRNAFSNCFLSGEFFQSGDRVAAIVREKDIRKL